MVSRRLYFYARRRGWMVLALAGGTLAGFAQTPILQIERGAGANDFLLRWPVAGSADWGLQSSTALTAGSWQAVLATPSIDGLNRVLAFSGLDPARFFRLTSTFTGVDVPDGNFADENGDGIDGDASVAVFVAPGGTDSPTGGLTRATPVRTLAFALSLAVTASRTQVCVQAGTYPEIVELRSGVGIYGGYDAGWVRAPLASAGHRVIVTGGLHEGESQHMSVLAKNLGAAGVLGDVEIRGPQPVGVGRSSFGIVALGGASLTLERLLILAGDGTSGGEGAAGLDAVSVIPPIAAVDGGNAAEIATTCDNSSRGAGGAGRTNSASSSPSTRNMGGGTGGAGGTMDTDCSFPFNTDFTARPGVAGNPAGFTTGMFGTGGALGPANSLTPGGDGKPGLVINGGAGSAGTGASLVGSYWQANPGSAGTTGENGSGGGGGGGSGGNDDGTDSYGAGGGGGGAGGAAARRGGGGGQGGGGSFGVYALGTNLTVLDCTIVRGHAGDGGRGGTGGRGQPGGAAGVGGRAQGSPKGGDGGTGAHGGHGGGGGGGAGGVSVGIFLRNTTPVVTNVTYSGGAPGQGGAGGISAPGTPDDDGADGPAGGAGGLEEVFAFQ